MKPTSILVIAATALLSAAPSLAQSPGDIIAGTCISHAGGVCGEQSGGCIVNGAPHCCSGRINVFPDEIDCDIIGDCSQEGIENGKCTFRQGFYGGGYATVFAFFKG
ncbi:hypothetical protein NA57DRAFT_59214 [Rhizodiscina lignyota]|uniref:Uncharacterized protein n=1 Tax=Rhizodiscina lignyota TaxID=1504668 RepID=A0A9P4I6P9_9PEZI|nr:hypothetical protein NA57DRAFT_59214 [Rhizodiscina lignyota]